LIFFLAGTRGTQVRKGMAKSGVEKLLVTSPAPRLKQRFTAAGPGPLICARVHPSRTHRAPAARAGGSAAWVRELARRRDDERDELRWRQRSVLPRISRTLAPLSPAAVHRLPGQAQRGCTALHMPPRKRARRAPYDKRAVRLFLLLRYSLVFSRQTCRPLMTSAPLRGCPRLQRWTTMTIRIWTT